MSKATESDVAAHYGTSGLLESILDGARSAGLDIDNLQPQDLAPVDEFHTAGRAMTLATLDLLPEPPAGRVLDVGCGIGGTSRHLAHAHDCKVEGIDLTPEYVDVARALTERTRLSAQCRFTCGSALDMPFDAASFDLAVTFHVAMNIDDRATLYGEIARVLKPGACLALFDVMAGPNSGLHYPVPWATTDATSFLRTPAEMHDLLAAAGFRVRTVESQRQMAIGFFEKVFAAAASGDAPPPLGLHLLTGAETPQKFRNYADGLAADQIDPTIMIAEKL